MAHIKFSEFSDHQLRICGASLVSLPIVAYMIAKTLCPRKKITNTCDKIVVITGCDSGIGLDLARRMLAEGFTVIVTVLSTDSPGGIELRSRGAIVRVVEYPKYEQNNVISKLVEEHRGSGKKLHCLVNNAAIMTYGKANWYLSRMIQNQVHVNLTGAIMMTKTLLQSLIYDEGRIVNISSTMGILAAPRLSVYCATKAGLEAFSNSLRREGVKVVLVRPCNLPLQTCIMEKSRDSLRTMRNALDDTELEIIGPEIDSVITQLDGLFSAKINGDGPISDKRLIRCLRDSILLKNPARLYTAAPWYTRCFLFACQIMPESILDLLYRCYVPDLVLHFSSP